MEHAQPVLILAGAYGVGKSEVALNLALHYRALGHPVTLGDLDVVNVYFRSRERYQLLDEAGIEVISSSMGHVNTQDLPAVSGALRAPLLDHERVVIIDAGGDQAGLRPLALFRTELEARGELLAVVNHLRPENRDLETTLQLVARLEEQSRLPLRGLIVNSHLLSETTAQAIEEGVRLVEALAKRRDVPIRWVCGLEAALSPADTKDYPTLTIRSHLRSPWMS